MSETRIIVLVSAMAGGKDTLLNKVVNTYGINKMVSDTTRPPREHEICAKDYYFITEEIFKQRQEYEQYIEVRGYDTAHGKWYYGLPKGEIIEGVANIVIVDAKGCDEVKAYCNSKGYKCISIYLKCSFEKRIKRYMDRDKMDDKQVIEMARRMIDDYNNVEPYSKWCDYVWWNETESDLMVNMIKIGDMINVRE